MNTIRSYIMWPIAALTMSLIVSCGGGGGSSNPVLPGGASSPTVSVSDETPAAGSTFTVTIGVPSATDLYQASLEIDYNNNVIDIISPPAGGTPTSSATAVAIGDVFNTYILDYYGASATNLLIDLYNADNVTTFTGTNGTLVTFTFLANAAASGQSTIIDFSNSGTLYYYGIGGTTSSPIISSVLIQVP